jgi:hypothetical protein
MNAVRDTTQLPAPDPPGNAGANPLVVLTEGFQSAFVACVVLAGIGVALALLLLGRPQESQREQLEPVAATAAGD